jgi:hypothetical protein
MVVLNFQNKHYSVDGTQQITEILSRIGIQEIS